jgi:hypothetical protein
MHSLRVHPMHDSSITEQKMMISDLLRSAKNTPNKTHAEKGHSE